MDPFEAGQILRADGISSDEQKGAGAEIHPDSLQYLELSDNQLTSLPEGFPAMLHTFAVRGNQLTSLPEALPPGLVLLLANHSQLTSLPENLLTHLSMSGDPLPEQVLTNLHTGSIS
ncbi:hypothetical protein I6F33_36945 [Bradyrhizobium sp. BRP20]|uniref:hypothetical protein n=1 Tax=unclassified Bradyrhizobium TaxID=2631580 RepID=UPI001CD775BB|nr:MULTISPECIES: hypothetical protein [unclassified Bradyrhizobium]MCA1438474.1 hypothetical protein [Bradyrhizobium sp. BRP20]MCA1470740.1 hypothetical protein [Bradyrhizobium sp. IC3195]MCA1552204.1 hypothetical protein [Bradyrhizobium sp. BRP19]